MQFPETNMLIDGDLISVGTTLGFREFSPRDRDDVAHDAWIVRRMFEELPEGWVMDRGRHLVIALGERGTFADLIVTIAAARRRGLRDFGVAAAEDLAVAF